MVLATLIPKTLENQLFWKPGCKKHWKTNGFGNPDAQNIGKPMVPVDPKRNTLDYLQRKKAKRNQTGRQARGYQAHGEVD